MKRKNISICLIILMFSSLTAIAQDYFLKKYEPFDESIPKPEEFLGYPIGEYHTRHDLVVSYFEKLAELSNLATIEVYGRTHEKRKLLMLTVSSEANLNNLETHKKKHLEVVNPEINITDYSDLPIFVNLAYNVHGNEPSSTEAAILTAYTLIASNHPDIKKYRDGAVIFIDPTINPDGRDRHTQWVNSFKGVPRIADKYDIEHNEKSPNGRTNHYWFDLNRDLLLAVHPESQAKLDWYHEWYPNVVTDFHEMGTNSTYFFEPKNKSAMFKPVTPIENHTTLNDAFAVQFAKDLDAIGSLYFTAEAYDSTYPGYGSTYGDLNGSLSLLFEQASSRGHLQETSSGEISFEFTIRNQLISSFSTLEASMINKNLLYDYQNRFYKESKNKAIKSSIKGYVFGGNNDLNRTKAFLEVLNKHKIEVYNLEDDVTLSDQKFNKETSFYVPTNQDQYYMVQSLFETNNQFSDSVYYDASAWSLVNAYNMNYSEVNSKALKGIKTNENKWEIKPFNYVQSNYAYLLPWDDYNAPGALYSLQQKGIHGKVSSKPFTIVANGEELSFNRGTIMIPIQTQELSSEAIFEAIQSAGLEFNVPIYSVNTGFMVKGNGLGSRSLVDIKQPKAMMLVEGSVSSYEAGEVWHLLETRYKMPITKVPERIFSRVDLDRYNTIVLVSGSYRGLSKSNVDKLKAWVAKGNTLITTRTASKWAIGKKLVEEKMIKKDIDSSNIAKARMNYEDIRGYRGRANLGGAIFEVDLDITNPIGYGYQERSLPVYKNNNVWLLPSKNKFGTVARYTENPHIDGYITPENLNNYMKEAASIIVSKVGQGRVILMADNPNFRGTWYGTNKLFINSIFFGSTIRIP